MTIPDYRKEEIREELENYINEGMDWGEHIDWSTENQDEFDWAWEHLSVEVVIYE